MKYIKLPPPLKKTSQANSLLMECQIKGDVKFRCDAPRSQILMEPFETHIIRLLCILLETETKLEQRAREEQNII